MSTNDRREAAEPLAIDGLLTEDQRRLAEAVNASKPLPASNLEECWQVLENQRRVSVDDHLAFQQSIARPAQKRSEREVSRVLDLLDEIGEERAG